MSKKNVNSKKIKSGDQVVAIAGKDKGRTGKVIKHIKDSRVLVEGINIVKKHVRPNPNVNEQGGIKEIEAGIHISNIALLNPQTKKADKVGFKMVGDDNKKRKVRYFKSNDEVVDV